MKYLRDNPILAGCLGLLSLAVLLIGGTLVLGALGVKACVNALPSSGLDSVPATARDVQDAGFSFSINMVNSEVDLKLIPIEPRVVTCEELWALIEPHLVESDSSLRLFSESAVVNPDGSVARVPLECIRAVPPPLPTL